MKNSGALHTMFLRTCSRMKATPELNFFMGTGVNCASSGSSYGELVVHKGQSTLKLPVFNFQGREESYYRIEYNYIGNSY